MIRTQISLEPEEIGWLKRQARRHGTSLAGIVRRLIRNASSQAGRNATPAKPPPRRKRDKILERFAFVGCIKDGGESDAQLAEDYLYAEGEVR